MPSSNSFLHRFIAVLKPTTVQWLGGVFLSLALLIIAQLQGILPRIGVTTQAITATQEQFHGRIETVLRSPISAQLALMTFWALVGLSAYLVCWGIYNALVEARNEVTLTTAYTNRGHWRGPYETLAIKALAGVGLAMLLSSFWSGFSIWVALSSLVLTQLSVANSALAAVAVLGLAVQLYAVLVLVQLTFTPWYRPDSFTEQ
jgi:hypothetical protein